MAIKCILPFRSNATDFSGNGKDFTNNNSVTFVNGGPKGKCASFNGTNQYFTRANDTDFDLSTMTFSVWAYQTSNTATDRPYIFQKGTVNSQYYFGNPAANDLLRLQWATGGYSYLDANTSTQGTINKWVKWVVRFDGTNAKIFLNGVEKYTTSQGGAIPTTSTGEAIGYQYNDSVGYWEGQMAYFKYDNSAISVAGIKNDWAFDKGFI